MPGEDDDGRKLRGIDGGKRVSLRREDQESQSNPHYFNVPHEDSKGHSYRIDTRIPPHMDYQLNVAVQSRRFPWKTRAEAYRWCIWRGVVELEGYMDDNAQYQTMYAQMAVLVDLYREQRAMLDFRDLVQDMSRVINDLLSRGAQGKARQLIRQTLHQIGQFTDSYWRKQYEQEVRQQFGYLIKEE